MFSVFSRKGYRTVTLMPGLQRAWPEASFYGADQVFGAMELAYTGPPFGWWDVTDQYALARMDALLERAPGPRRPLFVFFPTISTHTPFTPTPPYQPDWSRILTPMPFEPEELDRAWSEPPDWLNLSPGYAQALGYANFTLGGYLRQHATRDAVLILIGDHQPPAAVSGEGAPWDVPVHIITSRPQVLESLRRQGFVDGLAPPPQRQGKIHALLQVLLDAFGDS
jgi:phosphoglycerol transferase MdoB-like AlkP superfamily enzyme